MTPHALTLALLALCLPSGLMAPGVSVERPAAKPWRPEPVERGIASWYGEPFHGRTAANGEPYDMHSYTAASRTLPLGTVCEVVADARSVVVQITDRGPYIPGRIIDLSLAAARDLGIERAGIAPVAIYAIAPHVQNRKEEI